nr:methyltransferase domain-containing protein [Pseudenhygromyxa sp. WMMC2535]
MIQSAESDEFIYHEALIHPAMTIHGDVRRVLVAGAGEGASLRELLRHRGVESIVAVDLDPEVVELCRTHLPSWHRGSFDDPRVELRFEDIQATLAKAADGSWDLIVLDITEPIDEGPAAALFCREFFAEVARVLADDGVVVLQGGELDLADLDIARDVRATLAAVFPWVEVAHTFVPSFHCLWGFFLAGKHAFALTPEDLEARVAELCGLAGNTGSGGLRMYDALRHRAVVEAPIYLREALAQSPGEVLSAGQSARLVPYERTP